VWRDTGAVAASRWFADERIAEESDGDASGLRGAVPAVASAGTSQ